MRRKLRDYQKAALRYGMRVQHPALFKEMRLGKTLVAIRIVKTYSSVRRVLIAGPYSTFQAWVKELEDEGQADYGIVKLSGPKKKREKLFQYAWQSGVKWFLMSKESHLVLPDICEYPWDVVIVDESTFLKAPPRVTKKKRDSVSKYYAKHFRDVPHRMILTGTPAPETPLNYFMQLQFLDPEILQYTNYYKFRHECFKLCGFKWKLTARGKRFLTERLGKYCFFLKRKDVNLGGIKVYEQRYVTMSPKMRKIYRTLEEEFLLEVDEEEIASTKYSITQFLWMRRLCGGFVDGEMLFNEKAKELENIMSGELSGQQVVVWARFTNEIDFLCDYFTKKKYSVGKIYGGVKHAKRDEVQRDFQSGKIQMIIGQPECFKYGVNLSAADTVIYYSSPDGGETRQQSEDRVVDTATKDSSLILDIVYEDSVEEDVITSLLRKETQQEMLVRIAQGIQRRKNNG